MMRTRAVHLPLQLVSQAASASAQQEQHRCLVMLQSYSEHGTGDVFGNAVLTGGVSSFVLSVTSNSSSSHAATRWVTWSISRTAAIARCCCPSSKSYIRNLRLQLAFKAVWCVSAGSRSTSR